MRSIRHAGQRAGSPRKATGAENKLSLYDGVCRNEVFGAGGWFVEFSR